MSRPHLVRACLLSTGRPINWRIPCVRAGHRQQVGPETHPDRPDSCDSAGCTKQQTWRLHLGPLPDHAGESLCVAPLKVDSEVKGAQPKPNLAGNPRNKVKSPVSRPHTQIDLPSGHVEHSGQCRTRNALLMYVIIVFHRTVGRGPHYCGV
jgi:hypothetical protein